MRPIAKSASPVSIWPRVEAFGSVALTILLIFAAAWVAFYPLWARAPWMAFAEDDFFYYLKIASNLAAGRGSTFNGIVATNGYHPLWMACLVVEQWVAPSARGVAIFLGAAIFCATLTTFELARRLFRRHAAAPLLCTALAACVAVYALHLYVGCMEVVLTIPLVLLLALVATSEWLWSGGALRWLGAGVLASAVVLSRWDAALLIVLLSVAVGAQKELRARIRNPFVLAFVGGLMPIAAALVWNRYRFGLWLPVSAAAKQLKLHAGFSWQPWHDLLHLSPQALAYVLMIVVVLCVLPVAGQWLLPAQRAVYGVLLAFPVVYLLVLSWRSDWPLFAWYLYVLRLAVVAAFCVFLTWCRTGPVLQMRGCTALVAFIAVAQIATLRRGTDERGDMLVLAYDVQAFAQTHHGTYAMGDRAGGVGYLLQDPVVQTEGLVMDRLFLQRIAAQEPLDAVLRAYGVQYYVTPNFSPEEKCLHAAEPRWAGAASAHMRMTLCQRPVARFPHAGGWALDVYELTEKTP